MRRPCTNTIKISQILVPFAILIAALLLPGCQKDTPNFEVMSLRITPTEVTAGETATLTAEIKNSGAAPGVYIAALTIDKVEVERKKVMLDPGVSATVTYGIKRDKAGYYEVALGNRSVTLAVKEPPPPFFRVSEVDICPTVVSPGEEVCVTAKVSNAGGSTGNYSAELLVNQAPEHTRNIIMAPGENHTVVFTVSRTLPGTHKVTLNGITREFVVAQQVIPVAPDIPRPTPRTRGCGSV